MKLEQAKQYLSNVGGEISIEYFDDDFEPIGPMVRELLIQNNIAVEEEGIIKLKDNLVEVREN